MLQNEQLSFEIPGGLSLRSELSLRSLHLARVNGLLHERTDGSIPSIVFGREDNGRHGNFHPAAYGQICARDSWAKRLEKVHTAYKRRRARCDWEWKELDCSNSSDALLMNIFCYPGVLGRLKVQKLLNTGPNCEAEFGFKPRTPLNKGTSDNTEVDLRVGDTLFEAKLTESDFQWSRWSQIARYRDLEAVFDVPELPTRNEKIGGYQLVRGVLAAHYLGNSFCVLCDSRRPDLIESWYRVLRAVCPAELRCRLKLLTWQELASALPSELQEFLAMKYGIFALA